MALLVLLVILKFVVNDTSHTAATGQWRLIALTNNYSNSLGSVLGGDGIADTDAVRRYEEELAFLGWTEGPTPPRMRALFDDFIDSSTVGVR